MEAASLVSELYRESINNMRHRFILTAIAVYFLVLLQECPAMENISLDQAQQIAQTKLDQTTLQHHPTLGPDDVQEFNFGWVFGFAPKKFIESRDIHDLAPGPSLIVVERDGTVQFLPSSPTQHAIAEFARSWRARHH